MNDDKSIKESTNKKEWHAPTLSELDFRKTMTGSSIGTHEDAYDNNPLSGGN